MLRGYYLERKAIFEYEEAKLITAKYNKTTLKNVNNLENYSLKKQQYFTLWYARFNQKNLDDEENTEDEHEKSGGMKELDGQALIESFFALLSHLILSWPVLGCHYWLISIFPLLMIMVNICLIFRFQSQISYWRSRNSCLIRCMMWLPRLSEKFWLNHQLVSEFCRFICTLDLFRNQWISSKKPLTKAYGWPRVEALSPISWWVYLLVWLADLLPLPYFFEYVWSYVAQPPSKLLAIRQSAISLPQDLQAPGPCLDLCHSSYDLLLPSKSKSTTNPYVLPGSILCLVNSYLFYWISFSVTSIVMLIICWRFFSSIIVEVDVLVYSYCKDFDYRSSYQRQCSEFERSKVWYGMLKNHPY